MGRIFTWIKRLFFLSLAFLGLYYFGDFQISGVNVRGYLQSVIPPEKMDAARHWAWVRVQELYGRVVRNVDFGSGKSSDILTEKDREKLMDLLERNLSGTVTKTLEENGREVSKTVDAISEEDRQRLLRLLQDQLDVDAQALDGQNQKLDQDTDRAVKALEEMSR